MNNSPVQMGSQTKDDTTSQELVTEEQVKNVLHEDKGEEAELLSWKVQNFTKDGDNYASVVICLHVNYIANEVNLDARYIVKLTPHKSIDSFKSVINAIFMKETRFYLDLLPVLNSVLDVHGQPPLNFPRCFQSSYEMRKETIYFEDLRQKGFQMVDRKRGMSVAQATLVVKELARLHASSLLLQEKYSEPIELQHDFLTKDLMALSENSLEIFENNLRQSIEMLKEIGGYEKAINWIESLIPQLEDIYTTELKNYKYDVVCHGDCWNNNVLFRYNKDEEPIEVMLLDLQVCRKASPTTDLNYFLYTTLEGNIRRPNLKNLLSSYYDSFKSIMDAGGMAMPFSEEELMTEFRARNKLGGISGMMSVPFLLLEAEVIPDISSIECDYEELLDFMMVKAMDLIHTSPLLEQRFLATFDEFMETGLIS